MKKFCQVSKNMGPDFQSRHRQYCSVLKTWANDAVAVPNFRPFEGVGGPIGPIFWPQVIWSLAPMALMQKNGSNRPRLAPAAGKLAKSQHRASMLCKPKPLDPDFSRIRQKFKILIWYLFLDFGPNSKTTKKIQIGGDAKKGQKK